jgi:hypothetical protein
LAQVVHVADSFAAHLPATQAVQSGEPVALLVDLPAEQPLQPFSKDEAPPMATVVPREAHSTLFEYEFPDAVRQWWLPPFSKQ